MTYQEATRYLKSLPRFCPLEVKPMGLEAITALLCKMGNPHQDLSYVHITGTNGKGSTTTYLRYLLQNQIKVGVFTSPFIKDYREMIAISSTLISPDDFTHHLRKIIPHIKELSLEHIYPSEFEILVAIALAYFKEQNVDLVLLEVGLGGLLDATNVIPSPLVSIITNIDYDHQIFLGDTLEEIATHKVGIIKEGTHVITYRSQRTIDRIIEEKVRRVGATLTFVEPPQRINIFSDLGVQSFCQPQLDDLGLIKIKHLGTYQVLNATLALMAAKILTTYYSIHLKDFQRALNAFQWTGRLDILSDEPMIILDGAHNPLGCRALVDSLDTFFPDFHIHFLVGILTDKDREKMLSTLSKRSPSIHLVPINSHRFTDYEFDDEKLHYPVYHSIQEGLEKVYLMTGKKDLICICGTLTFIHDVKEMISQLQIIGTNKKIK